MSQQFTAWSNAVAATLRTHHKGISMEMLDREALEAAYSAGISPVAFASQTDLPLRQRDPSTAGELIDDTSLPPVSWFMLRCMYKALVFSSWTGWALSVVFVVLGFYFWGTIGTRESPPYVPAGVAGVFFIVAWWLAFFVFSTLLRAAAELLLIVCRKLKT